MINDYECGSIAQRIINGTDKLPMPDRKRYVYIVYDENHGCQGIYGSQASADRAVMNIAFNDYDLSPETSLDYDDEDSWGWEGIAWWCREEVKD